MKRNTVLLKLAEALDLEIEEDKHKTGPKIYSLKSLLKALFFRHLLGLKSDKDLIRKLENFPSLRKACKLKRTPSAATISRVRDKINFSEVFYQLVKKSKRA
jgi:hypothetical protein